MTNQYELERAKEHHNQAYGALGAAEDISWWLAFFIALSVHQGWHNWYISMASFFGAYYCATWQYRRAESKTEDAYYRLAHLGKYSQASS